MASTSLVCWSKMRIFQTGGPEGGGVLKPDEDFAEFDSGLFDKSAGLFRFNTERRAAVCDCWSVDGAVG